MEYQKPIWVLGTIIIMLGLATFTTAGKLAEESIKTEKLIKEVDSLFVENAKISTELSKYKIFDSINFKLIGDRNFVTMYHPVWWQCDETPDITADGSKFDVNTAGKLQWVAISWDLHANWGGQLRFGDFVYLDAGIDKHSGIYRVSDLMNRRWKKRIDILKSVGDDVYAIRNVKLFKIEISGDASAIANIIG